MPIYLCRNLTINNIKQKYIVCTVMKILMIQGTGEALQIKILLWNEMINASYAYILMPQFSNK